MASNNKATTHPRKQTILVVEDEVRSQRLLRLNLEPLGYRVITTDSAQGVVELVQAHQPVLIVLDLKLPDGDGFTVCQQVRAISPVPIIILTIFSDSSNKVRGLELGADDYVTKPYDPAELTARIDAVLRRARVAPPQHQPLFHCGPLTIDFDQRRVTLNDTHVALSPTEYSLLEYLARNAGRTLVADALLANVWGPEYMGDHASLHLYISRLRKKLSQNPAAPRFIQTKPGIGYMLLPPTDTHIHSGGPSGTL
jgi:two-component system KDP operon response regulator KdpE